VHRSEAAALASAVNAHPDVTIDVGQVVFGPATTMTCDGPLQHRLHDTAGGRWINDDVEGESGGGIVPITYSARNAIHATMWLTGLELFLLVDDPWRVYLSTDHPNAGPFTRYPQIIRLLMDRGYREQQFSRLHPLARKRALLPELDREYTLGEIAVITRAGPARALGLTAKGHLGVGADADIAVYEDRDDKEEMFAKPRYVFKGGELVVRDGAAVAHVRGRTFSVAPSYDEAIEADLRAYFKQAYTVSYDNYSMASDGLETEVVSCR
jgi:formylmethanofuran dehydrogenase subunit A